MQEMLQERMRLVADIPGAVANEEFFLEYQPIIDLGSRSLLGVEALVRWRHPELGVLMPEPVHPDRRGMRADRQARPLGDGARLQRNARLAQIRSPVVRACAWRSIFPPGIWSTAIWPRMWRRPWRIRAWSRESRD